MSKKHLLISEPPLQVLPSLAKTIGLNEAIALQQLHYWLDNPKAGVDRDGFRWVYNTYEDWKRDNFPFWSERTIQRIFLNLERDGLVIAAQLDKSTYDRKKYYRIDYDKLASLNVTDAPPQNRQGDNCDGDNLAPSLNESETTTEKTAETTTDTNMAFFENAPADWKLSHGLEVTQDEMDDLKKANEAPRMFEKAFGFNSLPWGSNRTWEKFQKFVTDVYKTDRQAFGKYIIWRKGDGKYSGMSNKQIRLNPQVFMDTGWPEFANGKAAHKTTDANGSKYVVGEYADYIEH